jgi:hypothetical protein
MTTIKKNKSWVDIVEENIVNEDTKDKLDYSNDDNEQEDEKINVKNMNIKKLSKNEGIKEREKSESYQNDIINNQDKPNVREVNTYDKNKYTDKEIQLVSTIYNENVNINKLENQDKEYLNNQAFFNKIKYNKRNNVNLIELEQEKDMLIKKIIENERKIIEIDRKLYYLKN